MSSSSPLMELLRRGKKTEAKNPQPPSEKLSSSSLMELLKHEKQPEAKKSQPPSEKMSSPLMELLRRGKIIEVKNPLPPSEKMSSSPLMELLKHENESEEMNYQAPSEHGKQSEVKVDYFTLGEGVHSGSFKVSTDSSGSKKTIAADFGGSAIGRVSPLDSGFWWIILLRERSEVKKEMRLILKLCLSDDFDTSPTLLCADGCSMIDSRMGICGYPLEIRALFGFALRCAMQLLKPEDTDKDSRDSSGSKETIAADFGGSASVPDMVHAGKERLSSGNKRKGGDDEPDRANKRPIARLGRPRPPIEVYMLDHGGRITEVAPTLYSVENRDHVHLVGSIGSVGHMLSISSIESALRQCLISADIDPSRHIEHLYYSRRTDCWGEVQSLPTPSENPSQYAYWRQFKSSVMGVLVRKGDLQI